MTESTFIVPIKETLSEVTGYIKEKSTNVQIIADMFNLDKLNLVLTENGRVNMILDETTTINIPVEKAIVLQSPELFKSFEKNIRGLRK